MCKFFYIFICKKTNVSFYNKLYNKNFFIEIILLNFPFYIKILFYFNLNIKFFNYLENF